MTVEVFLGNEMIFNSEITRYSIMEMRLVIDLVGGFIETIFQNNKLYRIVINGHEEVIEKHVEFLSYNYNVQSMWKFDPTTGQAVYDDAGNHIVEYRRGENSLLFKAF